MYVWKNNGSTYEHMGANIQKSIKIDRETLDIINGCGGRGAAFLIKCGIWRKSIGK